KKTGRRVPEPSEITVTYQANQRMPKRPDKSAAIDRRQPQRHSRFFLHPIGFCGFLHAQEMHGGASAFLDVAPEGLYIIVKYASPSNPQPLALPCAHQVQRCVRILKILTGLYRLQVRAAKHESIRAKRI